MDLVNPVMSTIVLPYRGREASARELQRTVPALPVLPEPVDRPVPALPEPADSPGAGGEVLASDAPLPPLDLPRVRPTKRTYMALAAIAERGGMNNRQVGEGAQLRDQGQISKLLARLEGVGLVENTGGRRVGVAKQWWLTAAGERFLRAGLEDPTVLALTRPARRGRPPRAGRRGAHALRAGAPLAPAPRTDAAGYRRLLRAAVTVVDQHGYGAVTVAHIAARAKVSRRTFYELFEDREQCLLAVMEDIDAQLTRELQSADLGRLSWRERVRMGLWTVLRFFDRDPVLARFCVVESARGDDRMAAYRGQLLARFAAVIAEGGEQGLLGFSPVVAEGIAGGVVSILATRLSASSGAGRRAAIGSNAKSAAAAAAGPLTDLLGELMGLVVLPYLGAGLAMLERDRPAPTDPAPLPLPLPAPGAKRGGKRLALDPQQPRVPGLRLTYRTALVLEAIAQAPGISNLDVARHARINDQGQVSKLLARLQRHGLAQNTGRGQTQGAPNEWRLTPAGQELERGIREHQKQAA